MTESKLQRLGRFLTRDLWDLELHTVSWMQRQGLRTLRVLALTLHGYRRDELTLRASGLTFWSLISLAPLLAFVFTIFKGMGRGQEMIDKFRAGVAEMPEGFQDLLNNIINYVENYSTVGIGSVALVVLLLGVLRMMTNIEYSFNRVWGVGRPRPFIRKLTDYICTLVLAPMLMILGGALSGFTATDFWKTQPELVRETYGRMLLLTPLLSAWLAFFALYVIMPNTRIRFVPAAFSSLVAAVGWLGWQKFYVNFQGMLIGQQDIIFGAFASVPIFMFWLYVCWVIILFGCELAFAMQNNTTYAREQQADRASQTSRMLLALSTVRQMARHLQDGDRPFSVDQYARDFGVPTRLLNNVLGDMKDAGLVAEVAGGENEFTLLRSPGQLKVGDVIASLMDQGAGPDSLGLATIDPTIHALWEKAGLGLGEALQELDFGDLLTRTVNEDGEDTLIAGPEGA